MESKRKFSPSCLTPRFPRDIFRAMYTRIPYRICYSDSSPFSISKKNIEFQSITGKNCLEEVLPEPTRERIRTILNISSNEEMPAPKPSSSNCRFCKWRSGCAESFDPSDSLAVDASDLL